MTPLEHGKYYHIYNCGINHCNLFIDNCNYQHFLNLYDKHIEPVAETYAWCLMKNHFHLLVRIKRIDEILPFPQSLSGTTSADGVSLIRKPTPSRQFSHLFNAYAQHFNFKYHRTGSLFERPFERIKVTNERHFRNLILYIHHNPQKHGFTDNFKDYPWTSYGEIISVKPTKLQKEKVLGWFNDTGNFEYLHDTYKEPLDLKDLFLED